MDEAGIDVAVLSLAAPGTEPFEPSLGTKIARETNDALAEAIARHPDRYLGYATLAPKDADGACKELERCVKELGFRGWNTHSNFGDSFIDEKRYWPVLGKAEELDVPVYLHPSWPIIKEFQTYGMALAGPTFGFGAETALVAMRLITAGVFDAFPKLQIILGHYAEGLPFMLDRVDRPYLQGHVRPDPAVAPTLKRLPSAYLLDNFLASTSGNYSPAAFACTKTAIGAGPHGHRQRLPVRGHGRLHRLPGRPAHERRGAGAAVHGDRDGDRDGALKGRDAMGRLGGGGEDPPG